MFAAWSLTYAQQKISEFSFKFENQTLHGVLTQPEQPPKGVVLVVHGSGRTNAVAQNWHGDVRHALTQAGYATYMYDKQGCGKSEGTFDYNQPVRNSAEEVLAAIKALKTKDIAGAHTIGLWGISRAGWINPLVINTRKDIKFWISVSGVYARENFNYLLQENLLLGGMPKDSVDLIVEEWAEGNRIVHSGGSFEKAQAATQNLRKTSFLKRFNNYRETTKSDYEAYQPRFMNEAFDPVTGQQIYLADFESTLSQIECPVLAIFGGKDKNVEWRRTKRIYEETLGPQGKLTLITYPEANHNLFVCETGGFFEFQDNELPYIRPEGYLDAMKNWLEGLDP